MRNFSRVSNAGVNLGACNLKPVTIVVITLMSFCLLATAWAGPSSEVLGEVKLKPAGKIEKTAGIWVDGQYLGYLKATGIRPAFSEHLENYGIHLPAELFHPEAFARR